MIQTVILRCLTGLNPNLFKSSDYISRPGLIQNVREQISLQKGEL